MKGSTGILLIAVGLILLYVILSDKYQCFTAFIDCMTGADLRTPEGYTQGAQATPATPPIAPTTTSVWNLYDILGIGNLKPSP